MRLIDSNALQRFGQGLDDKFISKEDAQEQIDKLNHDLETHTHDQDLSFIGDMNSLETYAKDTLVGAINEIYREASAFPSEDTAGKALIADAVGEPLEANDTLSEMATDINNLLNTFKTNMINKGATVDVNDKFKSLIDKITTIATETNNGMQFATGEISVDKSSTRSFGGFDGYNWDTPYIEVGTSFEPQIILTYERYIDELEEQTTNCTFYINQFDADLVFLLRFKYNQIVVDGDLPGQVCINSSSCSITDTGFLLPVLPATGEGNSELSYIAIGLGDNQGSQGSQSGTRYATGQVPIDFTILPEDTDPDRSKGIKFNNLFDFKPSIVFIKVPDFSYYYYGETTSYSNYILTSAFDFMPDVTNVIRVETLVTDTGFELGAWAGEINVGGVSIVGNCTYYAIGEGEESNTQGYTIIPGYDITFKKLQYGNYIENLEWVEFYNYTQVPYSGTYTLYANWEKDQTSCSAEIRISVIRDNVVLYTKASEEQTNSGSVQLDAEVKVGDSIKVEILGYGASFAYLNGYLTLYGNLE